MEKTKKLFYLDDDADDLLFFKEAAESLGREVALYTNGQELLQDLRTQNEIAEVIFLDVHMPILNGEEILALLKSSDEFKHIPVVMISGAYPKKLVKHFMSVGANHLMKKPASNYRAALEAALKSI